MDRNAKKEFVVLAVLVLMLSAGLLYSGQHARAERRDGQVREDLRQLKHQIEMYFNEKDEYPLEWDTGKYNYVVVDAHGEQAIKWYVSGQLENKKKQDFGIDEEYNIQWRLTEDGYYEICGGDYSCEL